ncbi:hypothetical protein FACS189443_1200 [Planctomycetales bacterium]|nr:hypothetical protein FACS189443_1200 [Planctomycetales bacterium]
MSNKRAFTLVEMLVVVVIISILAAIITAAVAGAFRSGKRARIAIEMNQIVMALESYKNEFGEYPPDMFDDAELVRHVKKRWPRFVLPTGTGPSGSEIMFQASSIRQAINNVYRNQSVYPTTLLRKWIGLSDAVMPNVNLLPEHTNLQSLAVWLGGIAAPDGRFAGFGADSEAPFGRRADGTINAGNGGMLGGSYTDVVLGTPDKKTFLELEVGEKVYFAGENDGAFPCLVSKVSGDKYVPFIYFRGGADYRGSRLGNPAELKSFNFGKYATSGSARWSHWGELGTVSAYAKSGIPTDAVFYAANAYQLIHPGLDGKFGKLIQPVGGKLVSDDYLRSPEPDNTTPNVFGQEDFDNITNFSDYGTIKSVMK